MNDALQRNAELIRQNRDAAFRRGVARVVNAPVSGRATTGTLLAGTRVFDPVSGEEGEVIHVARENVVVPAAK